MKRKKCYIYVRVSMAMQVDGYSLEAQKDRLIKFAEFQKMDIVREYCDAGKSGKNITGRPEFSRCCGTLRMAKTRWIIYWCSNCQGLEGMRQMC